jgi:hypothetical protein
MKTYETPQAVEVGNASEVVLGVKDMTTDDSPGSFPSDHYPPLSIVDVDE